MTNQIQPVLKTISGQIKVSSLDLAAHFGKRHDHILQAIQNLISDLDRLPNFGESSEEFRLRNFTEASYINAQNKEQPCYELTRDGFTLLAMGFTGAKALQWKMAYITAFNEMESRLLTPTTFPTDKAISLFNKHRKLNMAMGIHKWQAAINANLAVHSETGVNLFERYPHLAPVDPLLLARQRTDEVWFDACHAVWQANHVRIAVGKMYQDYVKYCKDNKINPVEPAGKVGRMLTAKLGRSTVSGGVRYYRIGR